MLCTGGLDTPRHIRTEADVCADILSQASVPDIAILSEEVSVSTEENAIEARKVMQMHTLKTAILVSDNYHLLRAAIIFKAYGISIVTSPAQSTSGPLDWRNAVYESYREVAALSWYGIKSALHLPFTSTPF